MKKRCFALLSTLVLSLCLLTALTGTAYAGDLDLIRQYDVTVTPNAEDGSLHIRLDFEWEVLQLYIKYGYGDCKLYNTLFFCANLTDETALMTLQEFADKAETFDGKLWKNKNK